LCISRVSPETCYVLNNKHIFLCVAITSPFLSVSTTNRMQHYEIALLTRLKGCSIGESGARHVENWSLHATTAHKYTDWKLTGSGSAGGKIFIRLTHIESSVLLYNTALTQCGESDVPFWDIHLPTAVHSRHSKLLTTGISSLLSFFKP
jgi:hypothetical protein